MALVWAEPFDQYGGTLALVANSGYSSTAISGVNATGRTGNFAAALGVGGYLERALAVPTTTVGMGMAIFPGVGQTGSRNDYKSNGFQWESAANVIELNVVCMPDLSFGVYDRNHILKGQTPPNQYAANAWTWVEARAIGNSAGANTGIVEVRVNGFSRLIVNGIDLPNAFAFHAMGGFVGGTFSIDDWIVWDGTGVKNNTFMGDRRLVIDLPNANGATQNFTASAGSAFNCVNVVPPVDTTYIEGAAAGNVSEFSKTGIGINSTDIAAVVICGRMFKTDAGVASGRIGINSVGNVSNSAELFPGTTGVFFYFPVENDPNGGIPWTRASVDAANLRVTRVT